MKKAAFAATVCVGFPTDYGCRLPYLFSEHIYVERSIDEADSSVKF
jgi:hypothetical protein